MYSICYQHSLLRLNVRGMNDEGHVANFVETELAIHCDNKVGSFVQIRGLVPLFWEQPGLQTTGGLIRIKLSRGYACSHPSFERHFEWSLLHYGPMLCCNLLGERNQETMLSNAFKEHFAELSSVSTHTHTHTRTHTIHAFVHNNNCCTLTYHIADSSIDHTLGVLWRDGLL